MPLYGINRIIYIVFSVNWWQEMSRHDNGGCAIGAIRLILFAVNRQK